MRLHKHLQGRTAAGRAIVAYYAATVLFVLLDVAFSFNVRTVFLDGWPLWQALYYLVCGACFVLIWRFPAWSNVVAAVESLFSLSALIIHMWLRVLMVDGGAGGPVTLNEVINFVLVGAASYLALTVRSRAAHRDLTGG